jgi:hypothetical protein
VLAQEIKHIGGENYVPGTVPIAKAMMQSF